MKNHYCHRSEKFLNMITRHLRTITKDRDMSRHKCMVICHLICWPTCHQPVQCQTVLSQANHPTRLTITFTSLHRLSQLYHLIRRQEPPRLFPPWVQRHYHWEREYRLLIQATITSRDRMKMKSMLIWKIWSTHQDLQDTCNIKRATI